MNGGGWLFSEEDARYSSLVPYNSKLVSLTTILRRRREKGLAAAGCNFESRNRTSARVRVSDPYWEEFTINRFHWRWIRLKIALLVVSKTSHVCSLLSLAPDQMDSFKVSAKVTEIEVYTRPDDPLSTGLLASFNMLKWMEQGLASSLSPPSQLHFRHVCCCLFWPMGDRGAREQMPQLGGMQHT